MQKKKIMAVAGIIALACIGAGACAGSSNENNEAVESSDNVIEESSVIVSTEEAVTLETDESTDSEETTEPESEVPYVALYTSTDTDKESLTELVKNTIISVRSQINFNLSETTDHAKMFKNSVLNPALTAFADADVNNDNNDSDIDLTQKFNYGNDVNPFVDANAESNNWTYEDIAGVLGYFIFTFDENNKTTDYIQPVTDEYMKHFFIYNFYNCDVNNIDNSSWDLSGVTNTFYGTDKSPITYEVNYAMSFKHDGVSYKALIGNINGVYKVLDIIKSNDSMGKVIDTNANNGSANTNNSSINKNPNNGNIVKETPDTTNEVPNNVAPVPEVSEDTSNKVDTSNIPEGYFYNPVTEQIEPITWTDNRESGVSCGEGGGQNPNAY